MLSIANSRQNAGIDTGCFKRYGFCPVGLDKPSDNIANDHSGQLVCLYCRFKAIKYCFIRAWENLRYCIITLKGKITKG